MDALDMEVELFFHGEEFLGPQFDLEYEFDALKFFDFTRPESAEEALEAESWFQRSGSYPPSPFVINLNLNLGEDIEEVASPSPKSNKKFKSVGNKTDVATGPETSALDNRGDILKGTTKPMVRPTLSRSSSLLKPTASALAKQNQLPEVHSTRLPRFQKTLPKISEKSSKKPTLMDNQEEKRQKLEAGYLCKVSLLKQQSPFIHKVPTKPGQLDNARLKITIPKEPELETARRALKNWRCKTNALSDEHTKSNPCLFKARPLNRKILEAASLPIPKKSMPQSLRFQLFHPKATERAKQHTSDKVVDLHCRGTIVQNESTNSCSSNFANSLMEERYETIHSPEALLTNKKDFKFSVDNRLPENLSTELYNKLSLKPDIYPQTTSLPKSLLSAKGSKENAPSTLYHEFVTENIAREKPRFGVNCAADRKIPNAGPHPNISRSLDIR